MEGDSSRKIVEMICQTGQKDTVNSKCTKIERILKVNNMQSILCQFEDYREMVKTKARKQSNRKENPRCLADGNELLRFYATTTLCSFGLNGSSSLCRSINCGACRILRNGFFTGKDFLGHIGIFATSNSERALRYACAQERQFKRKALFVCRVIAGKIRSPVRKLEQGFSVGSGFDSLAWKVGRNKNVEELFLLNPRALLPCFVVIYKT